jgi:hypothetical protein
VQSPWAGTADQQESEFLQLEPGQFEVFRDTIPAAVGFTDASWNPTKPAEVDATDASLSEGEMRAVGRPPRFRAL